jgi:NADH-quinone oxidoreductase subunit L
MGILAILALVGGAIQIPGVDDAVQGFLKPTFAGSKLAGVDVRVAPSWVGLIIGALIALAGIAIAFTLWVRQPGAPERLRERVPALHTFLYNKWYFDELIDVLVVRPSLFLGRFAGSALENGLIGGGVTGSTTGLARATSAAVRRAQTGFLRYYVALMIAGIGGVALYFLIQAA